MFSQFSSYDQSSVSHYFTRGNNTSSVYENLNEIDTNQQLSEEEMEESETFLGPSEFSEETETEEDEFEKLKRQRQQERMLRQMPVYTIKDKTDDSDGTSASKTSSSSSHTSQSNKKFY